MRTTRSWIRGLRLFRGHDASALPPDDDAFGYVHARSCFRSVRHPERVAVYSLHESGPVEFQGPGDHRLMVVREFRRVPLHASALGLAIFSARAGCEAQVLAALAHFAERAVSLYQPPYLLLARSMEQPGISMLLAGMQAGTVPERAVSAAFSVEAFLPEITPLLVAEPEWYARTPSKASDPVLASVSPV